MATSAAMRKGNIVIQLDPASIVQIQQKMKLLTSAVRMKILKQIVLQGARIMKEQAIKEAPVDRARLYQSIIAKRGTATEGGFHGELARVIVSRSKLKVFHAHLVEYGHITILRGGKTGKPVPPNPFMMRAFDKTKDQVIKTMIRKLRKKVVTEVNALGGKRLPHSFASGL